MMGNCISGISEPEAAVVDRKSIHSSYVLKWLI